MSSAPDEQSGHDQPALRREAGLFQLVAYGVGNIIGAGIYVLVGEASGLAGGMVWAAFLIGAAIATFTGLSYAELSSMYPKAASEYIFLGRAYGSRFLSFLTGWTMLATEVVAIAAVALGFAGYLNSLIDVPEMLAAATMLVLLACLVLVGIKQSLSVNTVLSVIAIGGLAVVIVLGLFFPTDGVEAQHLTMPTLGIEGLLAATALVFFAYIGFDNIANLAEETKRPERTIPMGLVLSVAISTLLYVLVGFAATSLATPAELDASDAPLALAASRALGDSAFNVLAVTALLTTLNTCLVLIIVSSRMVYGMSREGVLPIAAGRVSRKNGSPYVAVVLVLAAALCFLTLGSTAAIARVTSFGSLLTFVLVNLAMLHLRRVAPDMRRPFKAPMSVGWLSITGAIGLLSCLVMLTRFNWQTALLGFALPATGAVVFWLYGRRQPLGGDGPLHEPHERSDWSVWR